MYRLLKRLADFSFSILLFLAILPLMLVIIILLYLSHGYKFGNIFYTQERIGKDLKAFRLFKFKTMNDKKDANGELLPGHLRITKVGRFLREFSLDELPQLINIIKGDMSVIGPRPLLRKYNHLYSVEQKLRFKVKPGITGLAQVNGRNSISWTKKFNYDIEYVKNIGFKMDLSIFFKTFGQVIFRKNINQSANATMEPFNGSN